MICVNPVPVWMADREPLQIPAAGFSLAEP